MRCPYCKSEGTRVVDSRQAEDGTVVRRRRICDHCGRRFTTHETVESSRLMVVKKDGRREAFDRNKVANGLIRACEKRPVSMNEIEKITTEIERRLYALGEKEVPSSYIGDLVMDALRSVDQVAFIRFASVYQQFQDVERFAETIDQLRNSGRKPAVRVAVDGPSGAGKSTIAKNVAQALGYDYIDTGAMYRAVGLKTIRNGIDPADEKAVARMMDDTDIDLKDGSVLLDGEDVSGSIRTEEVSRAASACAALPAVREKLVKQQRAIGRVRSVVMDGRDIGTNVFPDAQIKIFLTATPEERAKRRWKQLSQNGRDADYDEILRDVKERDAQDTSRKLNPLRKADDAVEIDSTDLSIDEVTQRILDIVHEKQA